MGVLRNIDDERFCQLVVAGTDPEEAYKATGGMAKNAGYAANKRMNKKALRARIEELMDQASRRAMLSRSKIIQRMVEDWDMCRQLGQMGPAATNARLLGSELHGMFVERKEVGGPGDFDKKTPDELIEYIKNELSELGMDAKEVFDGAGIHIDANDGMTLLPPQKSEDENS